MTRAEFDGWAAVTRASETTWQLDLCSWHNQGCYFIYKGGVDGVYLQVRSNGVAEIGTYEGALPHIGEALFRRLRSNTLGHDVRSAVEQLRRKLALRGVHFPELPEAH